MSDISKKVYVGVVEDNNDPKRYGRCRVRVQKIFHEISTEHLPWCSPYIKTDGKSFELPAIGKIVNVIFAEGNLYMPYYIYADKYNINLQDKLESLSEDEYDKFVALLFDHRSRIYSEKDGFTIDYLVNKIKIDKGNINFELKNNDGKINIGTADSDQPLILGDHFIMDWFMEFMRILIIPTSLVGNTGAPVLKPELDAHIQKFMTNPKKFISSNVFTVDNNKVSKLERDSITSEVEHDDTSFVTPSEDTQNTDGKNVESTTVVGEDSRNKIKENQEKSSNELKDAVPEVTMSEKLSGTTIDDLDVSTIDVPEDVDLSTITMKDTIDTSKVNLSTSDLSKITPNELNLSFLLGLGFTVLAIIGLSIIIIDKIKDIDKDVKNERNDINTSETKKNTMSTGRNTKINDIDTYSKPKTNNKRIKVNSPYSVDKRERTDILNSSKSKSYKRKTIIYKSNPNYGNYFDGII
jgi:type VI secretion system (T6SS) baseplate-like injector VgrG